MRKWRPSLANPDDPPAEGFQNYFGFQKLINSNNGEVDENILEEHVQTILADENYFWKELSPVNFSIEFDIQQKHKKMNIYLELVDGLYQWTRILNG
jgi:hypothetical protein